MNKRVKFSKYVVKKWESKNSEKYEKTERKKETSMHRKPR